VSYDQNGLPALSISDIKKKIHDKISDRYCRCGSLNISIAEKGSESTGLQLENAELRFSCIDLEDAEENAFDLSIATEIFASNFIEFSILSAGITRGLKVTIQLPLFSVPSSPESNAFVGSSLPSNPDNHFRSETTISELPLNDIESEKPNVRRILVVDDAKVSRTMVTRALHKVGYLNIETADDGITALELLQREDPAKCDIDLIIMDFEMPRMNGNERSMLSTFIMLAF
jgi:hypothetical protein